MKMFAKIICLSLFIGFAAVAQTNTAPESTNKPPAIAKTKYRKFAGKIAKVDQQAKVITLEGDAKRQILVTSQTKITKDKQPATFSEAAVGMQITGFEHLNDAGKWSATILRLTTPKKE